MNKDVRSITLPPMVVPNSPVRLAPIKNEQIASGTERKLIPKIQMMALDDDTEETQINNAELSEVYSRWGSDSNQTGASK